MRAVNGAFGTLDNRRDKGTRSSVNMVLGIAPSADKWFAILLMPHCYDLLTLRVARSRPSHTARDSLIATGAVEQYSMYARISHQPKLVTALAGPECLA